MACPSPKRLLISIHPRHVEQLFNGTKRFELRRVAPRLSAGDEVVVYATSPVSAVVATFAVTQTYAAKPSSLWRLVSDESGVSREEFDIYFDGAMMSHAIGMRMVHRFRIPVTLQCLRRQVPRFTPPQSYWYFSDHRTKDVLLWRLMDERRHSERASMPLSRRASR